MRNIRALDILAYPRADGGACTLEELWPGVRMSPCAYVSGLLHPLVIRELDLVVHGYAFTPAVNGMFVPFEDGSSVQLYNTNDLWEKEKEAEISTPFLSLLRSRSNLPSPEQATNHPTVGP